MSELSVLTPGDRVAVHVASRSGRQWWEVGTVASITPTKRIKLEGYSRYFQPDGIEMGQDKHSGITKRLAALTPEIERAIAAQTARDELKKIASELHKLSDGEVIEIYNYFLRVVTATRGAKS